MGWHHCSRTFRRGSSIERRKGICAKEQKVESGNNPVTSWYASSKI